jgi:hypothetical protein
MEVAMDLSLLQELKHKLVHDKDLMPVWKFFLDHFGEDPEFIALGEAIRHEFLETVLAQVGMQMFPGKAIASMTRLVRLKDQQFIHGSANLAGRMGMVFYFEDEQVGMVVVSDPTSFDNAKMARFSGQRVRKPGPPSQN